MVVISEGAIFNAPRELVYRHSPTRPVRSVVRTCRLLDRTRQHQERRAGRRAPAVRDDRAGHALPGRHGVHRGGGLRRARRGRVAARAPATEVPRRAQRQDQARASATRSPPARSAWTCAEWVGELGQGRPQAPGLGFPRPGSSGRSCGESGPRSPSHFMPAPSGVGASQPASSWLIAWGGNAPLARGVQHKEWPGPADP
jgi:hypothetical protein